MNLISWAFIVAGIVLAYWFFLRPVLRQRAEMKVFYADMDDLEASIGEYFAGLKTKMASWFVMLAPALVGAHDFLVPIIAGVDVTPLTAAVPQWSWPVILIGVGALFRWLRKVTTGPEA